MQNYKEAINSLDDTLLRFGIQSSKKKEVKVKEDIDCTSFLKRGYNSFPIEPKRRSDIDGSTGPTGPTGPVGENGLDGKEGGVGLSFKGEKGDTGPHAIIVGPTGPQGPKGCLGNLGPRGCRGPTGHTGIKGDIGQFNVTPHYYSDGGIFSLNPEINGKYYILMTAECIQLGTILSNHVGNTVYILNDSDSDIPLVKEPTENVNWVGPSPEMILVKRELLMAFVAKKGTWIITSINRSSHRYRIATTPNIASVNLGYHSSHKLTLTKKVCKIILGAAFESGESCMIHNLSGKIINAVSNEGDVISSFDRTHGSSQNLRMAPNDISLVISEDRGKSCSFPISRADNRRWYFNDNAFINVVLGSDGYTLNRELIGRFLTLDIHLCPGGIITLPPVDEEDNGLELGIKIKNINTPSFPKAFNIAKINSPNQLNYGFRVNGIVSSEETVNCFVNKDGVWEVSKISEKHIVDQSSTEGVLGVNIVEETFAAESIIIPYTSSTNYTINLLKTIENSKYDHKLLKFINKSKRNIVWNTGTTTTKVGGSTGPLISSTEADGKSLFYLMYYNNNCEDLWDVIV